MRRLALLTILVVAMGAGATAQRDQRSYDTGQEVVPVYEGWERNPDGSFNLVFGTMNRNWKEELHIPIGPANNIEPGGPDQRQPTYFLPRRNRFLFRVPVAADFGDSEVIWTLTSPNGETKRAYGTLKPDYFIDNSVIIANNGAGIIGQLHRNIAPTLTLEGESTRHAVVGDPVTLTAVARDPDSLPKPKPRLRSPTGAGAPVAATGLRLSWFVYRGPGGVRFDPPQIKVWEDTRADSNSPWGPGWSTPDPPAGNRWVVQATFSTPGTYVLRCQAHDGGLATTEDVTVVVTGRETSRASRTPWGAPDLQGLWNYNTLTPLERPTELEGRASLTDDEAAAALREAAERATRDEPRQDYNPFWSERNAITHIPDDKPTSLIVDPPDGKLPPLTAAAQAREAAWRATWRRPIRVPFLIEALFGTNPARGPEDLGLSERCLVSYSGGPPIMSGANNSHLQILQTADQVVLFTEMIHDVRVVPVDGRPHLPPSIPQWHGDARGHWEGDTLVVESRNFSPKRFSFNIGLTNAVGSGETLRLTERFTRLDPDTLRYAYTVDDPVTFTRRFTAVHTMKAADGPLFEYACHEGNYGLANSLSGARAKEREAERAASGGEQ